MRITPDRTTEVLGDVPFEGVGKRSCYVGDKGQLQQHRPKPSDESMADMRAKDLERDPSNGEGGATAVEYAIVASMIAAVIVGAVALIGPSLSDFFSAAASGI